MNRWGWVEALKGAEGSDQEDLVPMLAEPGSRGSVPRWIAKLAHRNYARSHSQGFEKLHQRGGFSASELVGHLAAELRRTDALMLQINTHMLQVLESHVQALKDAKVQVPSALVVEMTLLRSVIADAKS